MLQQRFAFYKKSAADKPEKLLFREMDFCEMYLNQYLTDIENHEKNGYEIVEDTDHALRATLSRRSQIELWAVNYNLDIGPIKERLEKYDEKWSRAWPQAKLIWPWVFNEGISGQFWYPKRWHWYQRGGIPDLQKNLIDLNLVPSDYFKRNHFAEVREMVMKK